MIDREPADRITRRDMLASLAGAVLSLVGFPALAQPPRGRTALTPWDDHFELLVDLEINQPQGFRSHRPYVAVWVEDPAGKPVRTLTLWVNTQGRGERYIRELHRWFRAEQTREAAGGRDLVSTISSATRLPGKYSVVWNGRDDDGKPVGQDVEAADGAVTREPRTADAAVGIHHRSCGSIRRATNGSSGLQ